MALYRSTCADCREAIEFTTESGWFHPGSGRRDCNPTTTDADRRLATQEGNQP
jgi:hypothetical protein